MGDFKAQELANTAWAFAAAAQADASLFGMLAKVAEQRMGDFGGQQVTNTLWAFATAGQSDASLYMALAIATKRHVGNFNSQGLANVAQVPRELPPCMSGELARWEAVHSLGESSRTAIEGVQCAGPRQHGTGATGQM